MQSSALDFNLNDKKLFFASDFHLGAPNQLESKIRERRIIRWLDSISSDAEAIFLVGDIFDFWFEYDQVIPKGFIPFISKISQLRDQGILVFFFTGNHDLWLKDYFTNELGIPVFHDPILIQVNGKKILVGHGDGLGPGDQSYKTLKKIFTNPIAKWLFRWLHPDIGVKLAKAWSSRSRITNIKKNENQFLGDDEWLWQYSKEIEAVVHHDYYVFGHRHSPLELKVGDNSTYFNLGEWVTQNTYLQFDSKNAELIEFEK
jgi:UDP-2,3-diacylglucosamine hydrolase